MNLRISFCQNFFVAVLCSCFVVESIKFDYVPSFSKTKVGGVKFGWSDSGPITGMHCIKIEKSSEPTEHTWRDNYFCSSKEVGMRWKWNGRIPSMHCTQISEPSDPHSWRDNHLCLPKSSEFRFQFRHNGSSGSHHVRWYGDFDPDTWKDNYLVVGQYGTGWPRTTRNWMNVVNGSIPIYDLVIPGTHDSAAYDIIAGIGETQDESIYKQLSSGIRFLDIRVANAAFTKGYSWELKHGILELGNFETLVLDQVKRFLVNYPSETVFMSIMDEGSFNKTKFLSSVISRRDNNFLESVTTVNARLSNLRGKIVIIDRADLNVGIKYEAFDQRIQDLHRLGISCKSTWPVPSECSIDFEAKANKVAGHLNDAWDDAESENLWINFASANWNSLYIKNSAGISNRVVERFFESKFSQQLDGKGKRFSSVVLMDYPKRSNALNSMIRYIFVAY